MTIVPFGGLNGQFLIEEFDRGARGTMPGSDLTSRYVARTLRRQARAGARSA